MVFLYFLFHNCGRSFQEIHYAIRYLHFYQCGEFYLSHYEIFISKKNIEFSRINNRTKIDVVHRLRIFLIMCHSLLV